MPQDPAVCSWKARDCLETGCPAGYEMEEKARILAFSHTGVYDSLQRPFRTLLVIKEHRGAQEIFPFASQVMVSDLETISTGVRNSHFSIVRVPLAVFPLAHAL